MKKRVKSFFASLCCSAIMLTSVAGAFTDLTSSHWAYNPVNKMYEKGVVSGFEDGTYRPDEAVTREQFATILVKTLGLTKDTSTIEFVDVEDDRWSKEFIDIASEYLTGYTGNGEYYFKPTEMAVREDIAVAIVKAKKLEDKTPDYSLLDKFSDKDEITNEIKKYVSIAVEEGIMNGNANGTFNPQGALTRAEIATVMSNVLDKIVVGDIEKPAEKEAEILYGDVNGDGEVNNTDLTVLSQYVRDNSSVSINKDNADVCIGKLDDTVKNRVNLTDKYVLAFYLAGEDIELPYNANDGWISWKVIDENEHEAIVTIMRDGEIHFVDAPLVEKHEMLNDNCIYCDYTEKEAEILYGDVNGDGEVNYIDSMLVLRYVEGESDIDIEVADMNKDGKITEEDAQLILQVK